MQTHDSEHVALRQLARRGMVLPADQARAIRRTDWVVARRDNPETGTDLTAWMSFALRIALVFWTGLLAGVACSWHFALTSGVGEAGMGAFFMVLDQPVFAAIFWGGALLHTVLAIEGALRWDELHAKIGFFSACAFLLFAKLALILPDRIAAGGGEPGAFWFSLSDLPALSGLMATAVAVSFLLVLLSLSVGRPPEPARA